MLPLLVGVRQWQLEVFDLGLQVDRGSTIDGNIGTARLRLHHEHQLLEAKVGASPKGTLTKCDEARGVQKAVGIQIVKLNLVDEKKAPHEVM